jgi:hypothetical protein
MAKKKIKGEVVSEADEPIENWASKKSTDIYEDCSAMYPQILKAYENREDADQAISDYWSIYNAETDDNQVYQGNSKCYVPVVRDALNARSKRALRQLFPSRHKHVDAIGTDAINPYPQLALLEHYIRSTKLKSICRSMLVAGDVTGQWSIYVDWLRTVRSVTGMIKRNPVMASVPGEEVELVDPNEEREEEESSDLVEEGPDIVDIATEDVVVIPPTCNDIEKADIVCVKLRMSKEQVKKLIKDGIFDIDDETEVGCWIADRKGSERQVPEKKRTDDAGVKTEGTTKYALIYEATARIEFEKGKKSLAYIYFAGENEVVGIIKAPQWGQKRPIISAPVDRIGGSFNGISKVEPVKWMQWNLNDFWNMGQDSAMYSMLPIVFTDPEKNPNYAMMVFGLAAVWPVDPNSTKFASFPQLWKDAMQMCGAMKQQIFESLDVNDMMMGKMPNGRKNAGAVGAQQQEQSVPIMDHAERFEEEILNPLMERFFEYDCQFREDSLTVLTMGEIGVKAAMQEIPPQQWGQRYYFQWAGTDFVMNMQRMQQQIATMNVLRGIPPQQLNGRVLDITPILEILTQNVFGNDLSGRILIDNRLKYTVPAHLEDDILANGMMVPPHEADNDQEHLQAHSEAARAAGDPAGLFRTHIEAHTQQLQKKREAEMGAKQQQPGQMGMPGGAAPGVAGQPRMGAQPQGPRPGQQPPGAIGPDQMGMPGRG